MILRRPALLTRHARSGCAALFARDVKVQASELRKEMLVVGSEVGQPADRILRVLDFTKGKAGKGGGFVQVTMRDMTSQNSMTHKFNSGDRVETLELDKPTPHTLLYTDDGLLYLMEEETCEQIEVPTSMVDAEQQRWLQDGMTLKVSCLDGKPLMVQAPQKVAFQVTESPVALSGENLKMITLENGERIRAPQYIAVGDTVLVYTADGTFAGRPAD